MKKKIINGLLFAVAMIAATSSFVSCKDYDADNYNELQAKYASLQDAFNKQVAAMQDYVLTTRYNDETGYSAAELAAKGTIKKRLDDLEKDTASLAQRISDNNLAIKKAQALAEKDSTLLHKLVLAWGTDLDVAIGKAAEVLATVANDSAKWNEAYDSIVKSSKNWNEAYDSIAKLSKNWNEAYDSIANRSKEWNKAVGLAEKANAFLDPIYDEEGHEITKLSDLVNAFERADEALKEEIEDLKEDVEKILKVIQQQVTGIEIQGTVNPIYGTFAYPIGVQSNILATYYGKTEVPVFFPAGDGEDADYWVGSQPVILTSELEDISAPVEQFGQDGYLMNDAEGNAGKLYLTVNPSDVDMTGKEFTLRTSDNKVSKVVLSTLEACTDQLKWGYKRAAAEGNSPNGFYVANATINKDDVESVALSFEMGSVKSQLKSIMNDWRATTPADIAKLGLTVLNSMQANVPRLGAQTQWKDSYTLGWKNWVSKYELAAVSAKPLGYDFLYGADYSGKVIKLKNKIFAKEKAIAQDLIDQIREIVNIKIGVPESSGDILVENDRIYLVIDATVTVPVPSIDFSTKDPAATITIKKGAFYPGYDSDGNLKPLDSGMKYIPAQDTELTVEQIEGKTSATSTTAAVYKKVDITSLFDAIADGITESVSKIDGKATDLITKYLNKIINFENKVFSKIESVAKNPNRFIQPALIASVESSNGTELFYPSRNYIAPTKVKSGTTISFYPTTLTAEVVAPAFKKYIAISGAKEGGIWQPGAQYNTGGILNTVLDGNTYNIMTPFKYTVNAPAGTVLEFIYECLGYNGKVAGKKYYIEVY